MAGCVSSTETVGTRSMMSVRSLTNPSFSPAHGSSDQLDCNEQQFSCCLASLVQQFVAWKPVHDRPRKYKLSGSCRRKQMLSCVFLQVRLFATFRQPGRCIGVEVLSAMVLLLAVPHQYLSLPTHRFRVDRPPFRPYRHSSPSRASCRCNLRSFRQTSASLDQRTVLPACSSLQTCNRKLLHPARSVLESRILPQNPQLT